MTGTEPNPKAAVCSGCKTSRPTRNGVLVCTLCDRWDLMPLFIEPKGTDE